MERKFKIPKKDDNFEIFSVRMLKTLIKEIDEIAKKTNRSRNEVVNKCVEYAIENLDDEVKEPK